MPPAYLSRVSSIWRSCLMTKDIQLRKLDIYHGLSHELPWGVHTLKTKKLVTIHDLIFMRYPQFFPWIDRKIYNLKYRHAIQKADIVISISQQTKQDLMEFLNVPEEKIKIIHQACHPSFYIETRAKLELPEHYILYVGALEERKNVMTLVQAFAHLKDIIPHKLLIVGKGEEYKQKIQREIINHSLNDRIFLFDQISSQELPAIYQKADLFVYPSFFEGWGIPNVEALISGVPVITSKGSCLHESAGPNSLYIDPYSFEDLAEKMKKILLNENLKQTMSSQGRIYAKQFHWSETSRKLMNLYQSLL